MPFPGNDCKIAARAYTCIPQNIQMNLVQTFIVFKNKSYPITFLLQTLHSYAYLFHACAYVPNLTGVAAVSIQQLHSDKNTALMRPLFVDTSD